MSSRFRRAAAFALCLASTAAAAAKGGYDEGYRHGFQDGYQQGLEAGRAGPDAQRSGPPRRPPPRTILVVQADYGGGGRTCDATASLAARLDGKRAGTVEVGNRLCGDPAPGIRKYLRVLYRCGGEQRELVAFERRALEIRCD